MRTRTPSSRRTTRSRIATFVGLPLLAVGLLAGQSASAPLAFFTEVAHADLDGYFSTPAQPLVGDFNGDGRSDVFFYRPGAGKESILFGNASRENFLGNGSDNLARDATYTPIVGDFDGNGLSDVFWYAPGTVSDHLWLFHTGSSFTSVAESVNGTYTPIVGDFASKDGHHADDIFWYAPGRTADFLWKGAAKGKFTSMPESVSGLYRPLVGAFTPNATDGSTDSTLDIFWYAPGKAADSLFQGDGNGHFKGKGYTVNGTYQPIVGLFDGYGVDDIFWYSPTGSDSVWLADPDTKAFTAHPASIGSGYTPITGTFQIPDEPILWWSKTGADHFWIPQGEPGTWDYQELSNNSNMGSGYTPVTGDFDGDGHNDILWLGDGTPHTQIWWGPG